MRINRCPKCGVEPYVIPLDDDNDEYCGSEVECYYCRLHTGCCETENEAILKWNEMTEVKKWKTCLTHTAMWYILALPIMAVSLPFADLLLMNPLRNGDVIQCEMLKHRAHV